MKLLSNSLPIKRKINKILQRGMDFEEEIFNGADYTKTPLPVGRYEYCKFLNCNFSESSLDEIHFLECEFDDCDFSNAKLNNTAFQDVTFQYCKMIGLAFNQCKSFGFFAEFNGCRLNHSVFAKMKLNRSVFINSELQEVDFTETILTGSKITDCDLSRAVFEHSNLERADLRGSVNYSFDPEVNRVKGCRFSLPDVVGLLNKYGIKID